MTSQLPNISRKTFTKQRRALSVRQRRQAAFLASRFLIQLAKRLPPCAKVAFYLDDFGELPTDVIARFCARMGWQAYLPITKPNQALTFAPVRLPLSKNAFKRHRLGMLEPITPTRLHAWDGRHFYPSLSQIKHSPLRLYGYLYQKMPSNAIS